MLSIRNIIAAPLIAVSIAVSAASPPDTAGKHPEPPKGSIEILVNGGIEKRELTAVVNPDGVTASVRVTIPPIPYSASTHSPHCAAYRVRISGISPGVAANRLSSCVRICLHPPAGYETAADRGLTGTVSHAWAEVFNHEWFADTGRYCGHVKQWSAHEPVVAILTIGVCQAGSGCSKLTRPAPTVQPVHVESPPREHPGPRPSAFVERIVR